MSVDTIDSTGENAPNVAGGTQSFCGVPSMISERSRQVSEQLFHLLVESVRDYSIYVIDVEGLIATWNKGAKAIKGYEAEEIIGKPYAIIFTPEDQASGRPARLLAEVTQTGSARDEGWRMRKDGSRIWCTAVLTALRNEDGTLLGFAKITQDNTAQHNEVQERRRSEDRFRLLLELAPDAIVIVNRCGNIVRINAQTEKLFGHGPDELIGHKMEILMPERFRDRHPQQRGGFMSNPEVRPMGTGLHLFGLHKDGHEFPVEISLSTLETEDGTLVSSAIRDITEQRRITDLLQATTDELRRSNADLDQFAAIASHDLREPLRMITNYATLLQNRLGEKLDDKSRRFMAYMTDGAKRMDDLINAILDYSHVGHQGIDAELVDAGAIVSCTLVNLEQKIRDTHATIDCRPLPPVVADRVLLGQLLQNLVSNAIKFTAKDRLPKIVINARESEHEWVFSVADNGIGIRAEDTERIFTLFQRLYSSSEYPGTGIGLATCKKIVERHHGRLWVESIIDVGTTFFFSLPKSWSPVAALDLLLHANATKTRNLQP